MFTSALRADQYLVVQIKCVVGALKLLESQLATALVAARRGWWLNKGTHERLPYSLPRLTRTGCRPSREPISSITALANQRRVLADKARCCCAPTPNAPKRPTRAWLVAIAHAFVAFSSSRHLMSAPKLRRQHCIGSDEYFDRG